MNYVYSYASKNAPNIETSLSELEKKFKGQRSPWCRRKSAIDILTVFEVAVEWGPWALSAKMVAGKYLDGLLNTDFIKEIGKNHRKKVTSLTKKAADEIRALCKQVHVMATDGLNGVFSEKAGAVVLILPIENISCYVVLNQDGVDATAIETIPNAVDRALELIAVGSIPSDVRIAQLFYDSTTQTWRYLFIPTNDAFGKHIDRCVSLECGQILFIENTQEFIERFHPSKNDELKFLVSPFREFHNVSRSTKIPATLREDLFSKD